MSTSYTCREIEEMQSIVNSLLHPSELDGIDLQCHEIPDTSQVNVNHSNKEYEIGLEDLVNIYSKDVKIINRDSAELSIRKVIFDEVNLEVTNISCVRVTNSTPELFIKSLTFNIYDDFLMSGNLDGMILRFRKSFRNQKKVTYQFNDVKLTYGDAVYLRNGELHYDRQTSFI